ncbi:MAG: hypothetical protein JWM47_2987 [Acidimicrobiales bacterium]|nr:hypothetical protein [Acidimicrobiales bacterium]
MAWLLRNGEVLASLEIATTRSARTRGLLGRDDFEGALLLERTRMVHSVGMRFPIDVAFCDPELEVVHTARLAPHRLLLPVRRARQVIEAEAGMFAHWSLVPGDVLEVRP